MFCTGAPHNRAGNFNDELDLGSKYKTSYLTISFVWQFLCGLNYKNLRRCICPFEGQQENCSPEQGHEALYKRGQDSGLPTSYRQVHRR